MDDITRQVRHLYDRFPYPPHGIQIRVDAFPRLLLSYLAGAPDRPLRVLDAGCGTGAGTVGMAAANPTEQFTAIDLNPVSLRMVSMKAEAYGLRNLKVQQVNLMTLQGLDVPDEGFDVIVSSGVLHHLSDPPAALAGLASRLAPHGVMALMVYGHYGRIPVQRFADAVRLAGLDETLESRLVTARQLFRCLGDSPVTVPPWGRGTLIDDAEFADCYLHPHALAYTVDGLFQMLEGAGLRFLRWQEPRTWSLERLLGRHDVTERISALPPRIQYQIVERLSDCPSLELVACHHGASRRPSPDPMSGPIARNPQAAIASQERWNGGLQLMDQMGAQVRTGPMVQLSTAQSAIVKAVARQATGQEAVAAAAASGVDPQAASEALRQLLDMEVLYLP